MSWNDNAVYFIVWSRYNCRAFFSRDYRKLPKTNQRTEGTDGSVNHTHLRVRLDWEVGLYVVGSEAKWCRLTTNRLEFNMTLNFVLGNNRDHPGGKGNFSRWYETCVTEQEAICLKTLWAWDRSCRQYYLALICIHVMKLSTKFRKRIRQSLFNFYL
jgi:hypothetical protein